MGMNMCPVLDLMRKRIRDEGGNLSKSWQFSVPAWHVEK